MLEIVDCKPLKEVKVGVVVFKVTARPAEEPCIAGELDLDVAKIDGDALLKLLTDGEFFGPGEATVAEEGEPWKLTVVDGEFLTPDELIVVDGEFRIEALEGEGDALIAGDDNPRLGRQCLTESEPDCESLLLLGEPGEETIT